MGFVPEDDTYRLTFADTKYAGLEVKMTGLSVGETLDTMSMNMPGVDLDALLKAAESGDNEAVARSLPELNAAIDELRVKAQRTYDTFAAHLVSWNVEQPQGSPVPATLAGVKTQGVKFIRDIIQAWRTGTVEVSDNLKAPSLNGGQSVALSLPMEPL